MPLLLLLAFATGCAPRPPAVPPSSSPPIVQTAAGVNGGLFLQGFDFAWRSRPHRLSRLHVEARGGVDGNGDIDGELGIEVRGGSWASGRHAWDTPETSLFYATLVCPHTTFVPGRTVLTLRGGLGRKSLPDVIPEATVTADIPLPAGASGALAAWLSGLQIDTGPSHPDGYTPRSIAVDLGEPTLDGGVAHLTVSARVEAAPVLDRKQQLGAYGAKVVVDYVVVVAPDAVTQRFDGSARLDHALDRQQALRKAAPARVPVHVDVASKRPVAVAGLSGFAFTVDRTGPVAGRYLRALTVRIDDERYDPARGTYDAYAELRYANAGQLPRPIAADARATFTLLELDRSAIVHRGRWTPEPLGQAHRVSYPEMTTLPPEGSDAPATLAPNQPANQG